ncbi:MAG: adenylosuccinate synthetase [Myxococcota bacterium]
MVERTATAIIGAGYGDEGKGLLTDALAARDPGKTVVVRFNGGAQAGHTVTLADGRRHVFSHFGAGSFAGASTFLSRYFVAHPMLFAKERAALGRIGLEPRVVIDPRSPVTTPWDMLINQWVENARGLQRHGSVGVGFGETLERHRDPTLRTTVADLGSPGLRARLDAIAQRWLPARLAELGLRCPRIDDMDRTMEAFLVDVREFLARVELGEQPPSGGLLFEGAQGLLLDQDLGSFPHVTRSHTGLPNVLSLAEELGVEDIEVIYVTRAYVTRHGAGPLAHPHAACPYPGIVDRTNRPNPYQGALRFGRLDVDRLSEVVAADLTRAHRRSSIRLGVAVTCLDQVGPSVDWVREGRREVSSPEALLSAVAGRLRATVSYASYGPTRETLSIARAGDAALSAS